MNGGIGKIETNSNITLMDVDINVAREKIICFGIRLLNLREELLFSAY